MAGWTVYLAGPDVFLPDAAGMGLAKRAICERHGLVGHFPLDAAPTDSRAIYAACLRAMRTCDAIVANLTPFRGPSADPGTAFELGFVAAMERPVFGYSNVPGELNARVDADGFAVEDFSLFDNLMLAEALAATGGVVQPDGPVQDASRDLTAFTTCVARAAAFLNR